MLTWFFEAPEKKFRVRDLRDRARNDLGITTRTPIYTNLDALRDLGLLKMSVSKDNRIHRYYLPDAWRSEKYAKDLDDYFNLTDMGYRDGVRFYPLLRPLFPIEHLIKIRSKKSQERLSRYKPDSYRKKSIEVDAYSHGLYQLMQHLAYRGGYTRALAGISKELKRIRSSEDLDALIKYLEEKESAAYPTKILKNLRETFDKLGPLAADNKTPKIDRGLAAASLKLAAYELERLGYAKVKEKKEKRGSHLETTFII